MRFILILSSILFLCGCGGGTNKSVFRIGIDSEWIPLNFYGQTDYVNGFIEELLLDMSIYSGMEFERVEANWDSLLDGMRKNRYDAVISSLPPYQFNQAHYDFSKNMLELGFALVIPVHSSQKELKEFSNEVVGALAGDELAPVLQEVPNLIVHRYSSVPELFNAVVAGEVKGAILDRLYAISYVRNLYAGKLTIAVSSLNESGLHLVTLKGERAREMAQFDKTLKHLAKNKQLEALLKKWQLSSTKESSSSRP